jgi:hypothetical protein
VGVPRLEQRTKLANHDQRRRRCSISSGPAARSEFLLVRYDRLTPKEKEYLRAMAHLGPEPHRSGDIANCMGAKVEAVAPRRSALIANGMIYSPAHGDTAFTVPLFDDYLKRALPGWRPKRSSPVKEGE